MEVNLKENNYISRSGTGRSYRFRRSLPMAALAVVALSGVVYAAYRTIRYPPVDLNGTEKRVNLILNVPYGTLRLVSGTKPKQAAQLEVRTQDWEEGPPVHYRYTLNTTKDVGTLRVTLGSDEGMYQNGQPFADVHRASSGMTFVSSREVRTDWGDIVTPQVNRNVHYAPISSDAESDRWTCWLTRDVPTTVNVQCGFGESIMDWTGLKLAAAFVETGASTTRISLRSQNSYPMSNCKISAGIGSFMMDGISNLNTGQFDFSGGVGFYRLNFNGKLARNLNAVVEVGLGKVAIEIPPDAARVQVFYDDSFFSSFSFFGLNKRREGYATSVGFDQSKAPTLTLRLSTGMGKMEVRYR